MLAQEQWTFAIAARYDFETVSKRSSYVDRYFPIPRPYFCMLMLFRCPARPCATRHWEGFSLTSQQHLAIFNFAAGNKLAE